MGEGYPKPKPGFGLSGNIDHPLPRKNALDLGQSAVQLNFALRAPQA